MRAERWRRVETEHLESTHGQSSAVGPWTLRHVLSRWGEFARAMTVAAIPSTSNRMIAPSPSTVQSHAIPRSGYTARTGPSGASGESADGDEHREDDAERH